MCDKESETPDLKWKISIRKLGQHTIIHLKSSFKFSFKIANEKKKLN